MLVHGNITAQEATSLSESIEALLQPQPLHPMQRAPNRAVVLPKKHSWFIQRAGPNPENINAAIENCYQIGFENARN